LSSCCFVVRQRPIWQGCLGNWPGRQLKEVLTTCHCKLLAFRINCAYDALPSWEVAFNRITQKKTHIACNNKQQIKTALQHAQRQLPSHPEVTLSTPPSSSRSFPSPSSPSSFPSLALRVCADCDFDFDLPRLLSLLCLNLI